MDVIPGVRGSASSSQSRAVPSATLNMETAHALPAPEEFLVYPTPYFKVRNQWLKQYAGLMLIGLTEAMQHQENARPLEISEGFAGLIGQYVQRVYRLEKTAAQVSCRPYVAS